MLYRLISVFIIDIYMIIFQAMRHYFYIFFTEIFQILWIILIEMRNFLQEW